MVPNGVFGYLSLWPDGENQPLVSTLNAYDEDITSNMAIVPTNNGSIDAYSRVPKTSSSTSPPTSPIRAE